MRPSDWAIIVAAAVVAVVAWRYGRPSRLALTIAVVGVALAVLGVVYAALGYAGCTARGDCSPAGAAMHTILGVALAVLVVLVVAVVVRLGWRRRPRRARRVRRPARVRARDVWMTVAGVPFALLSIALIVFGERDARLGGLACLLFSVAILLVPLSGRLAARSGIRPELGRVEDEGALHPALVIPGSAVKLRLMRVGMACFAASGLVLAIWPQAVLSHRASATTVRALGIACLLVFGGLLLLRQLYARGRYRIALFASGVSWELGFGPTFVAWDDVVGARAYATQGAWQLTIEARPGSRRDPPRGSWPSRVERALSRSGSSIPLEAFPVDPQRLAAMVSACAAQPAAREDVASERSLAWLTGRADSTEPVPGPPAASEASRP